MSTLAQWKAAAEAKLGTVHADVLGYISALEATVRTSRYLLIGAGVIGIVIGAGVAHLFGHK